ncbi:MAG: TrmH family RNA methyltransferase [Candidatus Binatia bacterium]|nr:TrmH family RNA methyltransferase [Candidatus Binatia bacterium]
MIRKKTTAELVKERPSPAKILDLPRVAINVVVDNVRSLDNVGLIFRLCELARVEHLYLTGYTGHPRLVDDEREEGLIARHESRIFKTAVYAVPFQPWSYHQNPISVIKQLKQQGSQTIALEQTNQSLPYHEALYQTPLTLIVGHEREGIKEELLKLADMQIEIPVLGLGNSHNVATATGIVLYHILEKTHQI